MLEYNIKNNIINAIKLYYKQYSFWCPCGHLHTNGGECASHVLIKIIIIKKLNKWIVYLFKSFLKISFSVSSKRNNVCER